MPVRAKQRRDSGAMLLAVLFMMALMVLTLLAVAPAFIQQAKRDREEEMIHRGTEYARAIRKYYRKFGRYPGNIEQLQNTNQLHFLRKAYKDPLTKDGQWKLLHFADIQAVIGGVGFIGAGGVAGLPNSPSAGGVGANAGAQTAVQQQLIQQQLVAGAMQQAGNASPFANGGPGSAQGQTDTSQGATAGQAGGSGAGPGSDNGQGQASGTSGSQAQNITGQTGSNNTIFGNTGVGGQTFGGGGIVGVASKSKDPTIRIYNKKKTYDEWMFIFSPMLERQNVLLRGPYNGMTFVGMLGNPAGQINQGQSSPQEGAPGVPQNQLQNQNPQPPPGNAVPPNQIQPQ